MSRKCMTLISASLDARIGDETSHEVVVHVPLVNPALPAG
jgi:hypothetical protein